MARQAAPHQHHPRQVMCRLRHRHTEQMVIVPLAQYLDARAGRYRNWCVAGQPPLLRPPVTISEMIAHQTVSKTALKGAL